MSHDQDLRARIETLERTVDRQSAVIATYEGANALYKRMKRWSFLGGWARRFALSRTRSSKRGLVIREHVVSSAPDLIGVCNPLWSGGVRSATFAICPDVVEVSEIHDASSARRAAEAILRHGPSRVMLSGYPLGYDLLAREIKRLAPTTRIFTYVHSAFVWFDQDRDETKVFEHYLELAREGVIERVGFCKRDVAEFMAGQGVDTVQVMNPFPIRNERHELSPDGVIRIGVWGPNLWYRNLTNQIVAGLMIDGSEIHVNDHTPHGFLDSSRIVVHGLLSKDDYESVMRTMDINLYIGFTDCFPMTVVESLTLGIPCLTSDTSDVYAFDADLARALVVSTVDGPMGIASRIRAVLADYPEIQDRMAHYIPKLRAEVDRSIAEFLR